MSVYKKRIIERNLTMQIERPANGRTAIISIDDPENLCEANAFNGDHAIMELSLAAVKELRDYLTEILELERTL